MQSRSGTLIAFEGIDGSGKTVQLRLLKERLEREGYEVVVFDFPRYAESSSFFIRQYLSGKYGHANQVSPYNASLFFALDRFEAAPDIHRALKEGKVVLCNRYTGSNMAHQGTKFGNPEERRGFFIWADNLEFQLLNVPRPDKTIVLRVPATKAQELIEQRGRTPHVGTELDVHEADPSHLQRAADVYDDLSQLFPKDFQRIDCMRDNQLLSTETIHDIVRNSIEPLLPVRQLAATTPEPTPTPSTPKPQAKAPERQPGISKISRLFAHELNKQGVVDHEVLFPEKKPDYYTPDILTEELERQYWDNMDQIFNLFQQITRRTADHLQRIKGIDESSAKSRAFTAAQALLPMASLTNVALRNSSKAYQQAMERLVTSPIIEVSDYAQRQIKNSKTETVANDPTKLLETFSSDFLPNTHASVNTELQLVSYAPRNELDIVSEIMYEHTNLPLGEVKAEVNRWPIARKQEALTAYLLSQADDTSKILDNVRYSFDMLLDYATQTQLLQAGARIKYQPLTPRYGYSIPEDVENAGLSEMFEKAVDLSLDLYNSLQQHDEHAAIYAVLAAHKQRCMVSLSYNHIRALKEKPAGKLLASTIQEFHPLLSNALST